eukprot:gene26146-32680_t
MSKSVPKDRWTEVQRYLAAGQLKQLTCVDTKFHGQGVFTNANYSYTGKWLHGQMHGFGRRRLTDSCVIQVGEFRDGKLNGQATVTYGGTGGSYTGHFVDDLREGFGVRVVPDGGEYRGEWVADKRHGQGTSTASNFTYTGGFADNDFYGEGTLQSTGVGVFSDGNVYTGRMIDGAPDDTDKGGLMEYANGSLYQGHWRGGRKHGAGTLRFNEGIQSVTASIANSTMSKDCVYKGDWVGSQRHGHGLMVYANGDTFTGAWRDDKRSGSGGHGSVTLSSNDHSIYSGPVDDLGRMHGKGIMRFTDGSAFRGSWHDGLRHGLGAMFFTDGREFHCNWVNDKATNHPGTTYMRYVHKVESSGRVSMLDKEFDRSSLTYADDEALTAHQNQLSSLKFTPGTQLVDSSADVYRGDFVGGKRHGRGVLTFANGSVLSCMWRDDKCCDMGVIDWNGTQYRGAVNDEGLQHGTGILKAGDQVVYSGEWREGLRHGQGELHGVEDGTVFIGQFSGGLKSGDGVETLANGDVITGAWVGGKKEGAGELRGGDGRVGTIKWQGDDGKGKIRCANKEVYNGCVNARGERHGLGKLIKADRTTVDCEWVNGLCSADSEGVIAYPSGELYRGALSPEGQRHGHGVMRFANRDEYSGSWVDDKMHGKGEMEHKKSGTVEKGEWCDGLLSL